MRRLNRFVKAVQTEARRVEKTSGVQRTEVAVQLALRVKPSTIPADTEHAARRLVKLVFLIKRDVPAA